MSAAFARTCLMLLASALLTACATAPSAQPRQAQLDALVDAHVLPAMQDHQLAGMAVGILLDGRAHYFNHGVASRETGAAVDADTLFEIGSISKVYAATIAGKAVADGVLDLDAPVSRYVGELGGSSFEAVSVLQAGVYAAGGLPLQFPQHIKDDAEALRWLAAFRPTSQPGTERIYGNPSLGVFGLSAARSLGLPYEVAFAQVLVAGLGLRDTWLTVPAQAQGRYAQGYRADGSLVRLAPGPLMAEAGGVKTSMTGLLDFLRLQFPGHAPSPSWQQAIAITQTGWYRTPLMEQGLGWERHPWPVDVDRLDAANSSQMSQQRNPVSALAEPAHGMRAILLNKTGGTNGFSAYVAVLPEQGIAVAFMTNGQWPRDGRVRAAHAILSALAPPPVP